MKVTSNVEITLSQPSTGETITFAPGETQVLGVLEFYWLSNPEIAGGAVEVLYDDADEEAAAHTFTYGLRQRLRADKSDERHMKTRSANGYVAVNGVLDSVAALILNSDDFGYAPISVKQLVDLISDSVVQKLSAKKPVVATMDQKVKPVKVAIPAVVDKI